MYLNLIEVAESFGVSETVVDDWIRNEGLPHTPDRGRLLFDRAQVAEWAVKRGLAAKAGFLAPETSALLGTSLRLGPLLRALVASGATCSAADVPAVFERIVTALPGATPPVRQLLGQRVRGKAA
jgi:PTS system nitrogen regulatory IIA component